MFLLIMTVVGGLLSLGAASWVALLAKRARWRPHNLARLVDQYVHKLGLHDEAYREHGNRLARHEAGQGPLPTPPFGGMDRDAHYWQVTAEHEKRVRKRTGHLWEASDRDVDAEVVAELMRPAIMAGLGVILSTVAGAWSLYLPPNF